MGAELRSKWIELWRKIGVHKDPGPSFDELAARYNEPHRAYHNFAHITDCLQQFEAAKHLAEAPLAVELAIWFHDTVYDSRATDNEERSAELAAKIGDELALPVQLQHQVKHLIMITKKHDRSADIDAALMADVDLSILGRDESTFDAYETAIRREYNWVPEPAFIAGRCAVLESFLSRPAIYATPFFADQYEQAARHNLKRSISRLKSKTLS